MKTKFKKLTRAQTAGLTYLSKNKDGDFYDLCRLGCGGSSTSRLVKIGLAEETPGFRGMRAWKITSAGQAALARGGYVV